ncbi:carboxymuconolactone decarboxylase family protein [Sphingomonas sp. CL5.1]|uniref:carboxymuconolactone decarboxylase family protein n=1 Tax=Sphingomonas sp. CL5.1 TaxID=2653203 RepID=UPI00158315E1|nr:carboxymuconolactone decarboxylase family protein [Sphingomonas sp. CL5.1]QKR98397.1 carboxymuconolactone decarboxylase family protein [Sphingomonas sp. CL5.1]
MARIPFPDPARQDAETLDRLTRLGSLNVTRMMSHSPRLMNAYARLGSHLLLKGSLDPVLREAVILRVGQLCGSDYEWHQHVSVARAIGMPEAMLEAIAAQRFDMLPSEIALAVRIAEEIHRDHNISEESFAAARALFSDEQFVELTLLPGFYIMTAGYLRALDIEVEETGPLGGSFVQGRRADR